MEEQQRSSRQLSGIIRFVVFLLLLAVVSFFIIRWATNRQTNREAQEAAQPTQSESPQPAPATDSSTNEALESPASPTDSSPDLPTPAPVPTGVADITPSTNATNNQTLPATGINFDVFMTTVLSSTAVFLLVKNNAYRSNRLL